MLEAVKENNGKILLAALAGVSAGIITGLLLAPEAGANTRQGIINQANSFSEIINKALRKYTGKAGKKKKKKAAKRKKKEDAMRNLPKGLDS
ncbi:YtxH domain-containing protein [Adhaeribacter aquaticus]|uniref:YtxH domain-containing protein n=1 Tax=Adhaeribacter aquaticus TaxID=299567 RepID=UPI0003F77731|nr:YtxH domain-containing protein [Adhaeribacter aquaticus]